MSNMQNTEADTKSDTYEPTESERALVEAHRTRHNAAKMPRLKVESSEGRVTNVSIDHPSEQVGAAALCQSLGAADSNMADVVLGALCQVAGRGKPPSSPELNNALAFVQAMEPKDGIEATLATQMYAVHIATMDAARRLAKAEILPQFEAHDRAFNKLARTFTTQMEALKRYRTGGEQKMTVEHVTVNEGGQAIVGNVSKGEAK
jgi:hypothetical protein